MHTRHRNLRVTASALLLALLAAPLARASEPPREQAEFFENKVRPILAEHCFKCHSAAEKKHKGGLVLDSREGLLQGGDSGPSVEPGQPDKSLLIKAVRQADDLSMPPKGKLSDSQVEVLTQWVKLGVPWPGAGAKSGSRPAGKLSDEDRKWWAIQPLTRPAIPDVKGDAWSITPVDHFIYQRLQREGIKPSPPAGRPALIRRVYFDLVGLPPTPEEVDAFVADAAPDAYEKLIVRLLASPRYGERWARHWLDLVRYAESDGFRLDEYRPDAWRYRDYVIRSFNDDKPYDQFVREQLAGDELAPEDPDALAATGYLRHGIYEYNQRDVRTQWDGILNDLTDVTADVFLGLGMGCARCHDHKFDPILQKDYYRLRAFFAGVLPRDDVPLATPQQRAEHRAKLAEWEARTAAIRGEIEQLLAAPRKKAEKDAVEKFPADIQAMILKSPAERSTLEHQLAELAYRQVTYEFDRLEGKLKKEKARLDELRKQLAALDSLKPAPLPEGQTVTDVGPQAAPTMIPKRTAGPEIEPGYLTILEEEPAAVRPVPTAPNSTGRRSELARWLTKSDNPLSTRVIVNRIWQYHFGRGLVATSSDFGRLGEAPSHPELLDWLATRFVDEGWSIKKTHKLLLLSAAYRQAATQPAAADALKKDPENRLLWKMATRRLDAEQIRDAILAATGELDLTAGGPSSDASKTRRTVYTKVVRNTRDPLLDVFDAPEGFNSTAQRNVTTTPTQALLMMNSPFMLQRARALADRLQKAKHPNPDLLIESAFRLTLGRAPSAGERRSAATFLHAQAKRTGAKKGDSEKAALVDFCHVMLNANEFLYVD